MTRSKFGKCTISLHQPQKSSFVAVEKYILAGEDNVTCTVHAWALFREATVLCTRIKAENHYTSASKIYSLEVSNLYLRMHDIVPEAISESLQ